MGAESFTGNPTYKLEVTASLKSQSVRGNYSIIYYRVRVVNTGANRGYWTPTGKGNTAWADSNVGILHDLWNDKSVTYDFRKGTYWDLRDGTFKVYHRKDGSAEYWVNAAVSLAALGYAADGTGTRSLPKLSHVPPAPIPLSLSDITLASMTYRFRNNGDGDRPILGWEIGYKKGYPDPRSTVVLPTVKVKSSGTSVVKGLEPGKVYTFWSRGRNANGWGAWSSPMSATTRIGAKVKINGRWHNAIPFVKVKGKWQMAQPFVKYKGHWHTTE